MQRMFVIDLFSQICVYVIYTNVFEIHVWNVSGNTHLNVTKLRLTQWLLQENESKLEFSKWADCVSWRSLNVKAHWMAQVIWGSGREEMLAEC